MNELSPEARIIQSFLEAGDAYISGNDLALKLDISRVGVWNRLEKLKVSGFHFSAIRNRGYRLKSLPHRFHPSLFEAILHNKGTGLPFHFHEVVDSTNSEAERLISNGESTPFLVLADSQQSGRGRRGRYWHSPPHKNLYMSFVFRPQLPPARMQTITLWFGYVICRYFIDTWSLPVKIKWPNDIICHEKKLAGLLAEARIDSELTRDLIFGIGLNGNIDPHDLPESIASMATSLAIASGKSVSLTHLAADLTNVVLNAYQQFIDGQYEEPFLEGWPSVDFLQGKEIKTDQGSGIARGISRNGSLKVRTQSGTLHLQAGEISLSSNYFTTPQSNTNPQSQSKK